MRLLLIILSISLLSLQASSQSINARSSAPISVDRGTAYMNLLHT